MTLFENKNLEKYWENHWLKPLDFIKENFQDNIQNDPELKSIKHKKIERILKKNSGIVLAALLGGILSNDIVHFLFSFSNPVFADSFLVMDSGVDYVFAFIAAACSGGLMSLGVNQYYSRKQPKEEKVIIETMKKQLNKEEAKLLYTTYNAHADIKTLFKKIHNNPSIVFLLKKHYKPNSYSVVSKSNFFKTLDNILKGNTNNMDCYIFAYGIEDVKFNDSIKNSIAKKIS